MRNSTNFDRWRNRVRPLLIAGIEPDIAGAVITDRDAPEGVGGPGQNLTLPANLMRLLETLSCHRAAGRDEFMYRLAWRHLYQNPRLLEDAADRDVRNATLMEAAVRRDVHKMHAFVRFREVPGGQGQPAYFAWFEPQHEILARGSTFFVERFPNMTWTLATPDGAAHWNEVTLSFVDSPASGLRPAGDLHEELWRTYYRSICNVARINPTAMQKEMPQKYWKNLPEAAEIGMLIRDGLSQFTAAHRQSAERGGAMAKAMERALTAVPPPGLELGPESCRRCGLWQHATQAVLGVGATDARIMLVGEQPGDQEDLRGAPFVGPAGQVLDQAIVDAGLDRSHLFITNAVKHFKWEPRGRRRLHKRPDVREVAACNAWLENEVRDVKPSVIVALGATALRALLGSSLTIDAARSHRLSHSSGALVLATAHPSAVLRAEGARADQLREMLTADLAQAATLAAAPANPAAPT